MEEYTRGYNACNRKWRENIQDKIEELQHKEEIDVKSYGFAVDTYLAAKTLQELLERED